MKSSDRRAFTLLEMLTVVVIIGVLAGIILPAMRRAKEKAKMTQCSNNLLQFIHAIDLFRVEHDGDYPDYLSNLYPSYVDSKEMYLCPADYCTQGDSKPYNSHIGADGGMPWWRPARHQFPETDDTKFNSTPYRSMRNDEVEYCSYLYEFCGAVSSHPSYTGLTWKQGKKKEMTKGPRGRAIPIVRCFWHQKRRPGTDRYVSKQKDVLNVDVRRKNIYYSDASAGR